MKGKDPKMVTIGVGPSKSLYVWILMIHLPYPRAHSKTSPSLKI